MRPHLLKARSENQSAPKRLKISLPPRDAHLCQSPEISSGSDPHLTHTKTTPSRGPRSSSGTACGPSPSSPPSPKIRGTLFSFRTTDTPEKTCVCPHHRWSHLPKSGDGGDNGDGVDGGVLGWHVTLPLDPAQPKLPPPRERPRAGLKNRAVAYEQENSLGTAL
jgi:hypothetical protein